MSRRYVELMRPVHSPNHARPNHARPNHARPNHDRRPNHARRSSAVSMVVTITVALAGVATGSRAVAARRNGPGLPIEVQSGGRPRSFSLSIPAQRPPTNGFALVVQLHGGGGSAEAMESQTGFAALGRTDGFVVASPNGVDGNWNDGRASGSKSSELGIDDVAFLDSVITETSRRSPIDVRKVFVVGMSNGAFMANRYACDRSDRVTGIGLVSGTADPATMARCAPARAVALVDVHGTADRLVRYEGGTVARTRGESIGVDELVAAWSRFNGCSTEPASSKVAPDVVVRTFSTCRRPTIAYRIEGGGHTWPGSARTSGRRRPGGAADTISATTELWKVFSTL